MLKSVVASRANARQAWGMAAIALAGLLGGCFPEHEKADAGEAPDGGGAGGAAGGSTGHGGAAGGGSTGHDGGAAGAPDGGGGSSGMACTNACSTGTTRCASASTLDTCTVGTNGCTSFVASPCATGTVCERTTPAACVDPQWAEWPVSNSASDVAIGAPNLAALVDNLDGTVTDRVTSLMWEQRYHQSVYFNGNDTCAMSMTGGYTDWREATLIELISIGDFSIDQPSIDTAAFPLSNSAGFFWTGTPAQDFANEPYIIDYGTNPFIEVAGGFGVDGQPGVSVRCVR